MVLWKDQQNITFLATLVKKDTNDQNNEKDVTTEHIKIKVLTDNTMNNFMPTLY